MKIKHLKKHIVLFAFGVVLSTLSYGQTVSKVFKNASLKTVLKEVEVQTGLSIIYEKNEVNEDKLINKTFDKTPVENLLSEVLDKSLGFSINNKLITIFPRKKEESNPGQLPSAEPELKKITGIIVDETGEPLTGAVVTIKGSTKGTSADFNGSFEIEVNPTDQLIVSYMGYQPKELSVGSINNFNIILKEDTKLLQEVVVIGYGSVKKEDLTGSVTTVSANNLAKGMAVSASDLLVGKAPGVSIISDGGAPGSASTIRIRGGSSMSASNDPLIVIDGVPLDSRGIEGMANPLSTINPNDIESFTVLKDASATAIYGSRASNGVIIITTKKGQSGKAKVTYDATFSVSTKTKTMDVMNADVFHNYVTGLYGSESLQGQALGSASTNWQDQIFRTAYSTDHNLSISGSAGVLPYRVSVGYTNENGILKTSNLERWTGSVNLSPKFFNDHLKVMLNVKGIYNTNAFADMGAISAAADFDPTHPVYSQPGTKYGNGYYINVVNDNPVGIVNPLSLLEEKNDKSTVKRSIGNLQLDYKMHFLPDLKANLNLGYDISKSNGSIHINDNSPMSWLWGFRQGCGENREYTQLKRNLLMDFYLNYNKSLNHHRFDVMGGYSWQNFYRKNSNQYPYSQAMAEKSGTGFYKNEDSYSSENQLVSFFFRLNYTFLERYLLTVTVRDDGSSRFSKDKRWGLFPSAALAWKVKEESFLRDLKVLSDLKLRLGYGVTGQQNITDNDYPYMPRYTYSKAGSSYFFGEEKVSLLRPEAYDNSLKWEETTTYNAGLDYGFLNNRISGALDVYYRKTSDLLNTVPIPAGANFNNQLLTNVGELVNRGVEFTVLARPIVNQDWNWNLSYNISYNKNKITKLTLNDDPNYIGVKHGGIDGGTGTTVLLHAVGHPVSSFYVYEQIYKDGKPVEGAYVDQDKNGVIDEADLIKYKKVAPDVFMGLSSQLSYKNWDFNFALRANIGNYAYNNIQSNREAHGASIIFNPSGYLKNRMNSAIETNFSQPQYLSSYYVQNASFLRMDNVSLGYTFREIIPFLSSMRIYGIVQNPFVITKYKGLDPEFNNQGIDNNIYPRPRIFMLGASLNF